jgi:hypothetical protein
MVFDDTFSTAPYIEKCEVIPNWADLVKKSTEKVTDENYNLARMWLFPNAEDRDIAMQKTNNNNSGPLGGKDPSNHIPTGTLGGKNPSNVAPTRTFGGKDLTNVVPTTLPSGQLLRSQHEIDIARYTDAMGISQKDYIPSPVSVGQSAQLQLEDNLWIPCLIDLETSGLQRSPRIAALNGPHDVPDIATYSTSTTPSLSRQTTRTRPRLSFLLSLIPSVICGPLLLQTLILLMSSFPLWPISVTTLIG